MTIKVKHEFDIWTLIMSIYLVNQFYINSMVSIQRIALLGMLLLYVAFNYRYILKIWKDCVNKNNFKINILLFFIWIVWVMILPIINRTGDYSYIMYCFTFFSWTLYLLAIAIRLRKKYPQRDTLLCILKVFLVANCLYVLGTIIIILIPGLDSLIMNVIYMTEKQRRMLSVEKFQTRIGWAGFAAYTNGLKCSLSFAISLFFLYREIEAKRRMRIRSLMLGFLALLGNLFYARTGVICCFLCIIFFILFLLRDTRYWGKAVRYIFLGVVVGFFSLKIISRFADNSSVSWMFEAILHYMNDGTVSTMSTYYLFKMYFVPSIGTLILGDGLYTDPLGGYYMSTDVGFMRLILYGGLIFTIFVYYITLRFFKTRSNTKSSSLLKYLFTIVFILFEIKGESIIILLPFALVLCLLSKKESYSIIL